MDPDQLLETLRELSSTEDEDNLGAELFRSLDNWLSKGGSLPKDWRR